MRLRGGGDFSYEEPISKSSVESEVDEDQIDNHVTKSYKSLIKNCLDEKNLEYHCWDAPTGCFKTFEKYKKECHAVVVLTSDFIIISSGYKITEDNSYIGVGISPSNKGRDVILLGARRPKADVYKKNRDKPLFGYSPELTKDATEYKRLDFLHNYADKELSSINPYVHVIPPNGPITNKFKVMNIHPHQIKFKAKLDKDTGFAIPKMVQKEVPKWKKEKNLNWINMTQEYYFVLTWGIHNGKKITDLKGAVVSSDKVSLRKNKDTRTKKFKVQADYFKPDGCIENPQEEPTTPKPPPTVTPPVSLSMRKRHNLNIKMKRLVLRSGLNLKRQIIRGGRPSDEDSSQSSEAIRPSNFRHSKQSKSSHSRQSKDSSDNGKKVFLSYWLDESRRSSDSKGSNGDNSERDMSASSGKQDQPLVLNMLKNYFRN